jgi:hypothetical protein
MKNIHFILWIATIAVIQSAVAQIPTQEQPDAADAHPNQD